MGNASAAGAGHFSRLAFTHAFNWPATDSVPLDTAAPEVALVIVRNGVVEIEFTEVIDVSAAAGGISIDGIATTWSLAADGYTLIAGSTLAMGFHELTIGTQPLDLDGRGLEVSFAVTLSVDAQVPERLAYENPTYGKARRARSRIPSALMVLRGIPRQGWSTSGTATTIPA